MLGYARFRAAYEEGFYPLYEKPPGSLVDFYLTLKFRISFNFVMYNCFNIRYFLILLNNPIKY